MRHSKCLCCCKSNRMMRKKVKVLFSLIHIIFMFISISSHLESSVWLHAYVSYIHSCFHWAFLLGLTLICLCKAVDVGGVWVWAVNATVSLSIQRFLNVSKCFQFFSKIFLGLLCMRSVDDAAAYIDFFFFVRKLHIFAPMTDANCRRRFCGFLYMYAAHPPEAIDLNLQLKKFW